MSAEKEKVISETQDMNTEGMHLYEWAVVRYVPRVEREEFFNIGVILLCKRKRIVMTEFRIDPRKFEVFEGALTMDELKHQLSAFERVAKGGRDIGVMSDWPAEERFRWLTAMKSACIQTSRPHPGKTRDLDATFRRLVAEYL